MLEIKPPVPVTKFVTSDGKVHDHAEDARTHEGYLAIIKEIGSAGSPYEFTRRLLMKFDLVARK